MIDLWNNNFTSNLIAFVKKGDEVFYCMAEVEYWIVEWWNGYVDLSTGSLEDLYFEYLHRFKLVYSELKKSYLMLIERNDQALLYGNRPKLYIDFDKKYFVSYFHEQALENRLPENWTGKYDEVENLIPNEFRYWLQ